MLTQSILKVGKAALFSETHRPRACPTRSCLVKDSTAGRRLLPATSKQDDMSCVRFPGFVCLSSKTESVLRFRNALIYYTV